MAKSRDIEVFIRDCEEYRLLEWVESRVGPLAGPRDGGDARTYESPCGPVVLTRSMEDGPSASLWFNTPSTPWETDVDCARDAARVLGCTVRCDPGASVPAAGASLPEAAALGTTFLEIVGPSEHFVDWELACETRRS